MFRTIATALALVAFVGPVSAVEPPQFFLTPDGKVEQRVAKVEDDVAAIKRELAALKEQLRGSPVAAVADKPKAAPCACGDVCPCLAAAASATSTPAASGHWERQRVGLLRSKDVWVSDAPQAASTYALPGTASIGSQCPGGVCPPTSRRGR